MCGIFGAINPPGRKLDLEACRRGTDMVAHRGPDAWGQWVDPAREVYLGHRRLSILDLSQAANQPMISPSGKVLIYNGEIYNFPLLRRDLEARGVRFRTTSDTEVLLHALEEWGRACLGRLRGMFAFLYWDPDEQTALLARDPFGVKPLYVWRGPGGQFAVASELKSFYALPDFAPRLNRDALAEHLRFRCLSGDQTLLQGVRKLPPGSFLTFRRQSRDARSGVFWDPLDYIPATRIAGGLDAHREAFEELFSDTVRRHLISDVPVGAQFSGGVDSSLVAAMCLRRLGVDLSGFFCRVRDDRLDESPFALGVARELGMRIHQADLDYETFFSPLLTSLAWHQDEPMAHPNSLGIHLLSALAKQRVTVLLSGETADETFAGYDRYRRLLVLARLCRLPGPLLALGARLGGRLSGLHPRLETVAGLLGQARSASLDDLLVRASQFTDGRQAARLLGDPRAAEQSLAVRRRILGRLGRLDTLSRCRLYDLQTYLPPILDRQDKMSMAASVETRVPFADVLMFGFAFGLPQGSLAGPRRGKVVLKEALARYAAPRDVLRPKMGFGIPLADWFGRPRAREMLRETLSPGNPLAGELDMSAVAAARDGFAGGDQAADELWTLSALFMWADLFLTDKAADWRSYRVN